ncbi:MAG TPA: hypothetical protein VH331_07810 [Allosphingosinicella sp.]|jgi:hypothetical protein|nr:hypothetical protein [Allosphingosinicella sp.]
MRKAVILRPRDLNYLTIVQYPVLLLCKHWFAVWSKDPRNAAWIPAVPDWALPFSFGVALATLIYDVAFREHSRIREVWHYLTDTFTVDFVHAGSWTGLPDTDIGVRGRIRFRRRLKGAKLMLRVYSIVGHGRKPFHHLIKVETLDVEPGEERTLQIVTLGIPRPGWDHMRPRGWGPQSADMPSFIGASKNVAIIEVRRGLLVQRLKLFIELISHPRPGPQQEGGPCLYVQDQHDDVFDVSETNRLGYFKYG